MTIDLRTARPGCVVEFRCGGKATIKNTAYRCPSGPVFDLWFEDYWRCETFLQNGKYTTDPRAHPLDITGVTDPPLTDAERLAEIAKIARSGIADWRGQIKPDVVSEILTLAEGEKS